jgi:hypothetical protein
MLEFGGFLGAAIKLPEEGFRKFLIVSKCFHTVKAG